MIGKALEYLLACPPLTPLDGTKRRPATPISKPTHSIIDSPAGHSDREDVLALAAPRSYPRVRPVIELEEAPMSDPAHLIATAQTRLAAAHEELERAIELLDELAGHAGYADVAPVVRTMAKRSPTCRCRRHDAPPPHSPPDERVVVPGREGVPHPAPAEPRASKEQVSRRFRTPPAPHP